MIREVYEETSLYIPDFKDSLIFNTRIQNIVQNVPSRKNEATITKKVRIEDNVISDIF